MVNIIIEPTGTGYSAYSHNLPGCIATGATEDGVRKNMEQAIIEHTGTRDISPGYTTKPEKTDIRIIAKYMNIARSYYRKRKVIL